MGDNLGDLEINSENPRVRRPERMKMGTEFKLWLVASMVEPAEAGGRGPQARTPCPYSEELSTEMEWKMGKNSMAIAVTIAFSIVGVLGDYFLKLASASENALKSKWFYLGFALYASTAFGWVFVMRHLKLATISVVYSISMVLLLTLIGVVFFRETLNYYEIGGLVLAVGSLILLMRFA